ncbi:MAG TPA: NACHT domain-containing protein [Actinoplanes sp.]|jgi:predicted kinase
MRSKGLSFADAVRILDGDSPLVGVLGQIAGIGAGAVTVGSGGTVDFFALRDQMVSWGHGAVRGWRDKVQGLGRFDRTDKLLAAHSVIVLVAFFEALDEWLGSRGFRLQDARMTAAEQVAVTAHAWPVSSLADTVTVLIEQPAPAPSPRLPFEQFYKPLTHFYLEVGNATFEFLGGLRAFGAVKAYRDAADLAGAAVRHYAAAYRRLAAEIPEFRLWSDMTSSQATRLLVRDVLDALPQPEQAVLSGLVRRYRARLGQPILDAADTPAGLELPSLAEGYIEPSGLLATAGPDDVPATERWWSTTSTSRVHDVHGFALAHFTSPEATDRPLVILGQPGSGKSVLTRRLAARLAEADFLPVRVELRTVRTDAPVQTQIEQALYLQLGEQVTWPELVRRAGTALPVVMMDGFDELLQATGQNWADYLEQLRDFQQREEELGRPLAVLVTSRTVVADRARFPRNTAVLRLEPFDDEQIAHWLAIWNTRNADRFSARGLQPLALDAVRAHRELTEQPLLLLLLALYDGQANHLQTLGGGLGRTELYERLFQDFFERQVAKFDTGRSDEQRALSVQSEWRRLSAVAIAMYNRGRDVITDAELDADLPLLLTASDRTTGEGGRPLTPAQMLVGRFFFVHDSQASTGTGGVERSYEFLHATFGEFLGARQIVQALVELAEESAFRKSRTRGALDAGYFHALTSFVSITRRAPLWEFCQAMIAQLSPSVRASCRDMIRELLPTAGYPQPTWSLADYEPVRRTLATRQAAFSANLVSLAVLLCDGPVDVVELVGEPVVASWRRQALLWMGQLEYDDARRMWQAFRVAWDLDGKPARLLIRLEDGADVSVLDSLPWPAWDRPSIVDIGTLRGQDAALPAESSSGRILRKSAFVQTGFDTRELIHVLIPFWRRMGDITFAAGDTIMDSDARLLLETLLVDGLETMLGDSAEASENRERFARGIQSAIEAIVQSRRPATDADQGRTLERLRDEEAALDAQLPLLDGLEDLLFGGAERLDAVAAAFLPRTPPRPQPTGTE